MDLPPLYRLWDDGAKIKDYHGRDVYLVGIQAYAKEFEDHSPHEFVNEYVCGLLAQAIGLPVAHGVFVERKGVTCYASFNSYMSGTQLPPCVPPVAKEIVTRFPELACGIVIFDLWINNGDRHKGNVGYDRDRGTVHIFDHGDAPFRGIDPIPYLRENMRSVSLGAHCIAPHLNSRATYHVPEWLRRIGLVPDEYIERILNECKRFGLNSDEARAGVQFLLTRRHIISELIEASPAIFPPENRIFRGGS